MDAACLLYAPAISWVVDFLKRIPVLAKYPKVVALLISLALSYLQLHPSPGQSLPLSQLLTCVLTLLAGSVGTHEIVSDPLGISAYLSGQPKTP